MHSTSRRGFLSALPLGLAIPGATLKGLKSPADAPSPGAEIPQLAPRRLGMFAAGGETYLIEVIAPPDWRTMPQPERRAFVPGCGFLSDLSLFNVWKVEDTAATWRTVRAEFSAWQRRADAAPPPRSRPVDYDLAERLDAFTSAVARVAELEAVETELAEAGDRDRQWAWYASEFDPAFAAMKAAEDAFQAALAARGLVGAVAGGKLYLDSCRCISWLDGDQPEHVIEFSLAAVAGL